MSDPFQLLKDELKALPGLGYRSAERIALELVAGDAHRLHRLRETLHRVEREVTLCPICGNLSTRNQPCPVCLDHSRDPRRLCVVEKVQDLFAFERSNAWRGGYHVLGGKLSPLRHRGPESLNLEKLRSRLQEGEIEEIVLALGNDVEGRVTCHYIMDTIVADLPVRVTRIGFGLPSGGEVTYADEVTLRSALEGRQQFFDKGPKNP